MAGLCFYIAILDFLVFRGGITIFFHKCNQPSLPFSTNKFVFSCTRKLVFFNCGSKKNANAFFYELFTFLCQIRNCNQLPKEFALNKKNYAIKH